MQLFWFECRLICKHKLYMLYVLSFLILLCITIHPFSLGKNLAPMDEPHILLHTLLEDSEKQELKNEFLEQEIEALEAFLIGDEDGTIQRRISSIEEHVNIILTEKQKLFLEEKANYVVKKLSNGKYCKSELLSMDTAEFQKLEIAMSCAEVNELLDEVNEELGGWTHFAVNVLGEGESFRKDCVEIGAYNADLGYSRGRDGSSIPLSREEMLAKYDMEVEKSGYTGMFVPYVLDKLGLILSLAIAFVLALFQISNQGCTRDVVSIKSCSALKYMGTKCASIVFMSFLPCLISMLFLDIKLCMQGISFGYDVNPYIMLIGTMLILLPQVIFLTVLGMLAVIILNSAIVPFLLEAVFFGISVNDFYGSYGLDRIVIRFNLLANSDLVKAFLKDIIRNRIFVCVFSLGIFVLLVLVYHMQKYGRIFFGLDWLQRKREKIYLWKRKTEKNLEIKRIKRKEEIDFDRSSIYKYLFQLGYWKGIVYCAVLNIISYCVFRGDMTSEQIFMRFLPLNAIILFSSIGFAEQEGNCSELIVIKNRIHIYLIQFIMSSVLVTMFVCGFGIVCFGCSWEIIMDVMIFSVVLGSICTIFRHIFGVTNGTFIAVMVYIFAAISML